MSHRVELGAEVFDACEDARDAMLEIDKRIKALRNPGKISEGFLNPREEKMLGMISSLSESVRGVANAIINSVRYDSDSGE